MLRRLPRSIRQSFSTSEHHGRACKILADAGYSQSPKLDAALLQEREEHGKAHDSDAELLNADMPAERV
jgi:hypothetical protein